MTNPTAGMLVIGNEILSGRTADANINYVATGLTGKGIALQEVRIVRDEKSQIINALATLQQRYTYVFTTGGIGPTHDDITVGCIAEYFNKPLVLDEQLAQRAKLERGDLFTNASLKMCTFPQGAVQINPPGFLYPGVQMENVFVLAGIPRVMQACFDFILPRLQVGATIHSKSLDVMAGESKITEPLQAVQDSFPQLEIGSYPFRTDDINGTSLVVRGTDAKAVERAYGAIQTFVDSAGYRTR